MSFTDAKRFETMRAEMIYGGEDCDALVPRWFTYGEGDKQGDITSEPLQLDASRFPPGTVVSVLEPECEICGAAREPRFEDQELAGWASECECGFNWDEWEEQCYS